MLFKLYVLNFFFKSCWSGFFCICLDKLFLKLSMKIELFFIIVLVFDEVIMLIRVIIFSIVNIMFVRMMLMMLVNVNFRKFFIECVVFNVNN